MRSRWPRPKRIWRTPRRRSEVRASTMPMTPSNTPASWRRRIGPARMRTRRCWGRSGSWTRRRRALETAQAAGSRGAGESYRRTATMCALQAAGGQKRDSPPADYDTAVATRPPRRRRSMRGARRCAEAEQNIAVAQSAVDQAKTRDPPGRRLHRIRHDRAAAGGDQPGARQIRAGAGGAEEAAARPGQAESAATAPSLARSPGSSARRRWSWGRTFRRASS